MRWIWSRACAAATRFSPRSSIHFTGRPSSRAANGTSTSSTAWMPFWPKPPPTSQAMTRIVSVDCLSDVARIICRMCGVWVLAHTVRALFTGSTVARIPRGSIGAAT